MEKLNYFGNSDILDKHKVAFLCSRKYPPELVLKSYDWAIEQRNKGVCVISGFHSQIEKDVFHFLLKGTQPIILVLARGIKKNWSVEIRKALDDNRLLIISPFPDSVRRVSEKTALRRNLYMIEIADEVLVAHAEKGGQIEKLLINEKKVKWIDGGVSGGGREKSETMIKEEYQYSELTGKN